MQTPDDEQFEAYMKRFHPIAPEPVPTAGTARSSRRSISLWIGVGAAAVLVMGVLVLQIRSNRDVVPNTMRDVALAERPAPSEPLTVRSANTWLEAAPSFKAAVDGLAFRSQSSPLPQGKQSAVAVLGKEKIKL